MEGKFRSRKFWVAVGTVFSIALSQVAGVDVAPEAIAGLVVAASAYIFGQGIVDKSVVSEQIRSATDVGKLQMQVYIRNLESQLTELLDEGLPEAPAELTAVPPSEV
jgi:hypothetical protein